MKIPEIKLIVSPETKEAQNTVGYTWNKTAGTRHKLGGTPDGINNKNYPVCNSCQEKMTFYAQIDSIGEDYDLADCMVIHQFVCFNCFEIESQLNKIST